MGSFYDLFGIIVSVPYWESVSFWNDVIYTVDMIKVLAYFILISAKSISLWNELTLVWRGDIMAHLG